MLTYMRNLPLSIIIAPFITIFITISPSCAQNSNLDVMISTHKAEYQQGEIIRIVFTNNLRNSVFSHIQSLTPVFCIEHIEKKISDKQWEKLYAQCQFPHCIYEIDAPGEIKPGESISLDWKPLMFENGTGKTALLGPGIYRLAISYKEGKKEKWLSVYTNTFLIRSGRIQ